jgi:hypothetical protein
VRQRGIASAEYPIVSEIHVELFLHCRFEIDFGQDAKLFNLVNDRALPTHGNASVAFRVIAESESA